MHRMVHGGEGEIRTRGNLTATTDFKSVALDHSATSPGLSFLERKNVAVAYQWMGVKSSAE